MWHTVEDGRFLHVGVIDGAIPSEESENPNHRNVDNAGDEVASTVVRTGDEEEDAGDHVEEEDDNEVHPDSVHCQNGRLRSFWNLHVDVVEDERHRTRWPVVSTVLEDAGASN